jgi:hypothetical protein
MNIALSTFFIFILILPGLIALRSYYARSSFLRLSKLSIVDQLFISLIPATLLHTFGYFLFSWWFPFDFKCIGYCLFANTNKEVIDLVSQNFKEFGLYILLYNLFLWISAFFLANYLRNFVRRYKLDLFFPQIRFIDDLVFKLVLGETPCLEELNRYSFRKKIRILLFHYREFMDNELYGEYHMVSADIMVHLEDKKVSIYSGFVVDIDFNDDGSLRSIDLLAPFRRDLGKFSKVYKMPVNRISIPHSEVLNICIDYISMKDIADHLKTKKNKDTN